MEKVNLLKLKNNTRINVSHLGLSYNNTNESIKELNFHRIDGLYSYCTTDNGTVVNLSVFTKVTIVQ